MFSGGWDGWVVQWDAASQTPIAAWQASSKPIVACGVNADAQIVLTGSLEGLAPGTELRINNFAVGDWVDIVGTSIGKGFQGTVKRHNFKGSHSMSHGSMMGRQPGSIGSNTSPARVLKGMKMSGHMGDERVTMQSLRVLKIDFGQNLMAVHGSVPGPENSYVIVKEALKKPRQRNWRLPDAGVEELKVVEKHGPVKKSKKAAQEAGKAKAATPAPTKEKAK